MTAARSSFALTRLDEPLSRPAHTENRAIARGRLEQVSAQRDATSLRSRPVVSTNSRLFPLEQATPNNSPVPRRGQAARRAHHVRMADTAADRGHGETDRLPDPQACYGRKTSALTLARRFRQGLAGQIKPDRAYLVDRCRIGAAQVAGNPDRFRLVGAIQDI